VEDKIQQVVNNSTVDGGCSNNASGYNSTVGGGIQNTASGYQSTIGGGYGNCAIGYGSVIGGGGGYNASNTASGCHTGILGGRNNSTNNCNFAMIVGSCITAIADCTTHVNCLAIMNIPTSSAGLSAGMVWNDNGTLKIV
jgi:hypothetical protein